MSPRPTNSPGNSSDAPEGGQQQVDVLGCRDAAEQHDLGARRQPVAQLVRALPERPRVAALAGVDRHAREGAQVADVITVSGASEPAVRRDHEHAGAAGGRRREALRVGELAAEVERRDEAEDLAERSALAPDAPRELEGSAGASSCRPRSPVQLAGESRNTRWGTPATSRNRPAPQRAGTPLGFASLRASLAEGPAAAR